MARIARIDRLTELAKEHLDTSEEIVAVIFGWLENLREGILIATDKRVVSYYKRILGGYEFEVFPYSNMSSIEVSKELLGHCVSFYVSNNKMRMTRIQTERVSWWFRQFGCEQKFVTVQKFIEHVRSKMGKNGEQNTLSEPTVDVTEQIRKLAELKDQGILTTDEFETKKTELLAKL